VEVAVVEAVMKQWVVDVDVDVDMDADVER
jgi:hypothetical protein